MRCASKNQAGGEYEKRGGSFVKNRVPHLVSGPKKFECICQRTHGRRRIDKQDGRAAFTRALKGEGCRGGPRDQEERERNGAQKRCCENHKL